MWNRRRAEREFRALMRGVPRSNVFFSKSQAGAALWGYDEDERADPALEMSATVPGIRTPAQ